MGLAFSACSKELAYESSSEVIYNDGKAEVILLEAGTLKQQLSHIDDMMLLQSLVITGPINGSDLKLIRELSGADSIGNETNGHLEYIDLSNAYFVKVVKSLSYMKENNWSHVR